MKISILLTLFLVCCTALLAMPAATQPPVGPALSADQLDDLVAPIALYPDPLLSQILVACTYPLEVVEAFQWMQRNPSLTGAALTKAAEQQPWDPSIQALVAFTGLAKQLNQDIAWTTNLGNAFLSQQGDVMDAVQRMRAKAQQAGKLASNSRQTVNTTNEGGQPAIEIEPANPQVIYIPEYDPAYIWGNSLYYPYANWFYPPFGPGIYFGFGPPIPIGLWFGGGWGGWGGWGWRPGWGGHQIIVNNNFIHRYNFNASRGGSLSGRSDWSHDSAHRGGVPYASAALANRYGGAARQNLQARAESRTQSARPQQGAERMGNRQIQPNASSANRGAFGGVREGGAARMQSDHGFSSMGSRGGGGMGGGGGARMGGGGGARMGGGGGARMGGGGGHGGGGGGRR
jgi:hypothetical protein